MCILYSGGSTHLIKKFAWPAKKNSSDMRYFFTIRIPLVDVKSNLGIRKMSPEFCFD
jgi:hypothetical protein